MSCDYENLDVNIPTSAVKRNLNKTTDLVGKSDSESCPKNDSCTICLDLLKDCAQLGVLECSHGFCFPCIQTWSKTENSCPLCKVTFNSILCKEKSDDGKDCVARHTRGGSKKAKLTEAKKVDVEDRRQGPCHEDMPSHLLQLAHMMGISMFLDEAIGDGIGVLPGFLGLGMHPYLIPFGLSGGPMRSVRRGGLALELHITPGGMIVPSSSSSSLPSQNTDSNPVRRANSLPHREREGGFEFNFYRGRRRQQEASSGDESHSVSTSGASATPILGDLMQGDSDASSSSRRQRKRRREGDGAE